MARTVMTTEQVDEATAPVTEPVVEPKVVQTKSQALEVAVYAIAPAYVALQTAMDNGAEDGEVHSLLMALGRESGRVRRAVRLVQKGLKPTLDAEGNEVEKTAEEVHAILFRYSASNPIEPAPKAKTPPVTEGDEDEDEDETEALNNTEDSDEDFDDGSLA